jgi:hypothetical protein
MLFLLASCYPFNLSLKPGDLGFLEQNITDLGPVDLDLGAYTGTYTVTYTDGSAAGPFTLPIVPASTGKTIKTITVNPGSANEKPYRIGRPDTDSINLNIQNDGTLAFRPAGDGYIPIGSYAEFRLISGAPGGTYRLEADLDLMGDLPDMAWTPVGSTLTPFTGTFDGNNRSIHKLSVTGSGSVGLFGNVGASGTVKKVHIRSGSVTGTAATGGIAGTNYGTVNACSSAAAVSGSNAGGIVGRNLNIIIACYNTGPVSGSTHIGGVAGDNTVTITACYNTGPVSGSFGGNTGGVAGNNTVTITTCYNTGAVTKPGVSGYAGGVVGYFYFGAVASNYWLDVPGDDAEYGIGHVESGGSPANTPYATPFSGTAWPSAGGNAQWGIGGGSGGGKYWKDLGYWVGVDSVFPKLWFE